MANPGVYFDDPREAQLADLVWKLAAKLPGHWELHVTHDVMVETPWATKRIVYARDWITHYRESDGAGGIYHLNAELGGTDYTAGEIGNVEHFYVSALMGTLGGPAGGLILLAGAGVWELVIGPTRTSIAWMKKHGFPTSLKEFKEREKVVGRNAKHNWDQLTGPDLRGYVFGSQYVYTKLADHLEKPDPGPVVKPTPLPKPDYDTVRPGDWLSKIALRWYQDMHLWPLIWDANRAAIGSNPNKLKRGMKLAIPKKENFREKDLTDARKRSRNWRSYR